MARRIIVGLLLAGLFAALLAVGGIFRMAVFTLGALIAVYEMGRVFSAKGHSLFLLPAYLFAAVHYAIVPWGSGMVLCVWLLCVMLTAVERIFSKKRTTEDSMLSIFVLCYPMILFAALAAVISSPEFAAEGSVGMLLLFACPLMGDIFAFFLGSFLGKHKLCPHISPKKTVEGSVGGFAGGMVGGFVTWALQGIWGMHLNLYPLLAVGLICGGVGQIGDLFASILKRWAGIKDYGNIFPEHGGIMDRLDSVLMCSPIVLIYAYLYLAI